MCGAVAVGLQPDMETAMTAMTRVVRRYEPDARRAERLGRQHRRYLHMSRQLGRLGACPRADARRLRRGPGMSIRLENVGLRMEADPWLTGIDLTLEPGRLYVLLGRTGAGKTSLMRVLAGLDRPTEGRVTEEGRDLSKVPVNKRNLAFVYQQFVNYPAFTVYENIAAPLRRQAGRATRSTRGCGRWRAACGSTR